MTFVHRIALQVLSNPAFMRLIAPILVLGMVVARMPLGGGGGV